MTHSEIDTEMATVRDAMDALPQAANVNVDAAWTRLRVRMNEAGSPKRIRWTPLRAWSLPAMAGLAAAGMMVIVAVLVITIAPIRAWAENLLSIFRVEHVAVVDISSAATARVAGNDFMNQAIAHIVSEEVTMTEPPQRPRQVADAASASKLAGFEAHLIAGETPTAVLVRSTITAQMKLDSNRLQSIADEAGRTDLHIPSSIDGAVIGVRLPAGIMAFYGNCGDTAARISGAIPANSATAPEGATCVKLNELPSPTASVPQDFDPAQLAQVALQFAGLSATEAANFTQTVDWTSTFVLPVLHGEASYEKVSVNGIEAVLLRPKAPSASTQFVLIWVDNGIMYSLNGSGDNTTALNLAERIE